MLCELVFSLKEIPVHVRSCGIKLLHTEIKFFQYERILFHTCNKVWNKSPTAAEMADRVVFKAENFQISTPHIRGDCEVSLSMGGSGIPSNSK